VQTVDFVAFNLHDLAEQFDRSRTCTNQLKIFLTESEVLFSKDNNAMLTIVHDDWPYAHDLQNGLCSREHRTSIRYAHERASGHAGGGRADAELAEVIVRDECDGRFGNVEGSHAFHGASTDLSFVG
jgi:uncharacterized protein YcgI (DUF1989 family)